MGTPRVGLVLGAGGPVGHAFHAGVLAALADRVGFDARRAQVIVGTSAGSIVGALLRAGVAPDDLANRALGQPVSPAAEELFSTAAREAQPLRIPSRRAVRLGLASPGMLAGAVMRPWQLRPGMLAAALLPEGMVPSSIITAWLRPLFPSWPERPLWVSTVVLASGHRVVFGAPNGVPGAEPSGTTVAVADAVAASCAVPGLFSPHEIAGVRYVDGGVHSATNADLLSGQNLDLVVVSSPMSATGRLRLGVDAPGRQLARFHLGQEVASLRRRGLEVLAFQPTPEDQIVMGYNAMDQSRRAAVTRQVRESTLRRLKRADVSGPVALLRDA